MKTTYTYTSHTVAKQPVISELHRTSIHISTTIFTIHKNFNREYQAMNCCTTTRYILGIKIIYYYKSLYVTSYHMQTQRQDNEIRTPYSTFVIQISNHCHYHQVKIIYYFCIEWEWTDIKMAFTCSF